MKLDIVSMLNEVLSKVHKFAVNFLMLILGFFNLAKITVMRNDNRLK